MFLVEPSRTSSSPLERETACPCFTKTWAGVPSKEWICDPIWLCFGGGCLLWPGAPATLQLAHPSFNSMSLFIASYAPLHSTCLEKAPLLFHIFTRPGCIHVTYCDLTLLFQKFGVCNMRVHIFKKKDGSKTWHRTSIAMNNIVHRRTSYHPFHYKGIRKILITYYIDF